MQRKVILFSSYDQALSFRKRKALERDGGLFGIEVSTPYGWLVEAWDRFGDGSQIISSLDRQFAVKQLLAERCSSQGSLDSSDPSYPADLLAPTPGTVALVARFFSDVIGLCEVDAFISRPHDMFSQVEQYLIDLIAHYGEVICQKGFIEPGDALAQLSEAELPYSFEYGSDLDIPLVYKRFFEAHGAQVLHGDDVAISGPAPGVVAQFLLSAGPSAQSSLLFKWLSANLLQTAGDGGPHSALLVSSDPKTLFFDLSKLLVDHGVTCSLMTSSRFLESDFGRAYSALRAFLTEDDHDLLSLLDFVQSPYSGLDEVQASQITLMVRGDRALSFEEAHAMIHLMSPHFDTFEELFGDSDASLVLDYFIDVAMGLSGMDRAYCAKESNAISRLRSVYEHARAWNMEPSELDFALQDLMIKESYVAGDGALKVIICDPRQATSFFGRTFDQVAVCDLDARFYSAGEHHDSLENLKKKLGIVRGRSQLEIKRLWFEQVKKCAKYYFACERVLDAGGDEDIYPSFLWEEFVSALDKGGEVDKKLQLPVSLGENIQVQGEEHFFENSDLGNSADSPLDITVPGPTYELSGNSDILFLSRLIVGEQEKLILSPSAIETYINCPYLWFVSQRIRPNSADENLGPLEQGTFVHGVFEAFYRQLPSALGSARVTTGNLSAAEKFLSDVFDEQLALQPGLQTTRYVPVNPLERAQTENLKQTLIKNLSVQAGMMLDLAPAYNELMIEPDDGCEYAGVIIRGRVDRVDCNDHLGQFVVLDYKGSIAGHDAGYDPDALDDPSQFCLPHKVQALIYAQVLRRRLSMRPIGALYFSYRAKNAHDSLAGSFDKSQLDVASRAGKASAVLGNFEVYLDLIEQVIERKLTDLKRGIIDPDPLCPDSCKYCPVKVCSRRLS